MPASKAQRLTTAERRAKAIAMRTAGLNWDTIAKRLGYSGKAAACKDVTRALDAAAKEVSHNAAMLRHLELLRYDRLQAGIWTQAADGDVKAVLAVLQISDRRIDLLRLKDTPASTDGARSVLLDLARGLQVAADALGGGVGDYQAPGDEDAEAAEHGAL